MLAAWTAAEDNPWSSVMGEVLRPRGLMLLLAWSRIVICTR